MTTRRSFLGSILAAGMAPAIVKAEILMPGRKIIVPEWGTEIVGDLQPYQHEINSLVCELITYGVIKYQADKEVFFPPMSRYELLLKSHA